MIAMSDMLNVWYQKRLVGTLQQAPRGEVVFTYADGWLTHADAFAISLSLPLSSAPFAVEVSTAFFDNYLPEERLRPMVAKEYGLESHSTYDLLKAIGAECAGALSILPVSEVNDASLCQYKELSYEEFANYIRDIPSSPLLGGQKQMRLSLAGAQSKGALRITPEMQFYIPLQGAPSTHIIKPASSALKHLPENELFCMGLARHMGLDVPRFFLSETLPAAFIVERYDRKVHVDSIERIHQEDFCQALGLPSSLKYQEHGKGATLERCFSLLDRCENPQAEAHKLVEWVVYNVCIGNADAHAKNISFLYDQPKPRIAPFYDLVSTAIYPDLGKNLAMKIGNTNDGDRLYASKWVRFSKLINVEYDIVREIGSALATKLLEEIEKHTQNFIEQYSYIDEIVLIANIVKQRSSFLLEQWKK